MFKFVILLSAFACCALGASVLDIVPESAPAQLIDGIAGELPHLEDRIVGGQNASISSFPWQVSIQYYGGHFCGGSIYTSTIIVTAAHCLQDNDPPSALNIRAGSNNWNSGGIIRYVSQYIYHENYNTRTLENDIAIVRLSSPLTDDGSGTVRAIALAVTAPANGAPSVVSGWGTLYSGATDIPTRLQSVNVDIVSQPVCASNAWGYGGSIRSSMICAVAPGKDACQGDSGGPLVSGGVLVGVVSWGYGCADPNYPGVYADVAALRNWVINATNRI